MPVSLGMVDGGGVCVLSGDCFVLGVVCFRVKKFSSADWVCMDGRRGEFLCGMEHGVGKAVLMPGGACAAEQR